jgi:outer membrane receptor protein involved in Fe transport
LDITSNDSQIIRGDESNQLNDVDGYTVTGLRARYSLSENLEIFAKVDNLFDEEFETFGLLGEEPSELGLPLFDEMDIPIFLGAGAPRAAFLGLRYSF